jgi:hypothetical protein
MDTGREHGDKVDEWMVSGLGRSISGGEGGRSVALNFPNLLGFFFQASLGRERSFRERMMRAKKTRVHRKRSFSIKY